MAPPPGLTLGDSKFWSANSSEAMKVNTAVDHLRRALEKGCLWWVAPEVGGGNSSHLCIPPILAAAALLRVSMRLQRLRGRGLAPVGEAGAQGAHGATTGGGCCALEVGSDTTFGAELHRVVSGASAAPLPELPLVFAGVRRDQPLPMRACTETAVLRY